MLADREEAEVDLVSGIPDSGTGHASDFANARGLPYRRPFVKYTPTWPHSFMPRDQLVRDLVARIKLIPVAELIRGKRLFFCEDSIVRGTQLKDTVRRIFDMGAREVHMRPACPPLVHGCPFLNFSRSKSVMVLATRRAIKEIDGDADTNLSEYANPRCDRYHTMIERIRQHLGLSSLRFQKLDDLVIAIGLPKDRLCTYCWDGAEPSGWLFDETFPR